MEDSFNKEFERELELTYEKDKLEDVVKTINDEILEYINKRKVTEEHILGYRKNVIEDYKDDEDRVIEYFDHERFVREEAFRTIDKRLRELNILINAPYFGKVNFTEKGYDDVESFYIGRFGLTPEGSYEPVVVDWRAPISSLFYAGKLGEVSYKAPNAEIDVDIVSKRQFIIKNRELLGMFDSALDVKDEILQMVLSQNSEQKLKDIIMTIQAEQDEIIRKPKDITVVANGVAGSGKTTIALHRVAYLLYNFRETLQDKILILGPNDIFIEYISTVLPSLGEIGVRQMTFKEFALKVIGINNVMSFRDYMEKILSNDDEFIKSILYKTSEAYIDKLNSFICKLDAEYFKIEEVKFFDKVVADFEEIRLLLTKYYKDMPLFRRGKKIKRILFSKIRDERDERVRLINKEHREQISKLSKEQLETSGNAIDYMRKIRIRETITEVMRAKSELSWLDGRDCISLYRDINGDNELTIDDLAPIIYLKLKLEGIKPEGEIKHVVIDEAQDYSLLQFMVIKEYTGCNSMTVTGDSNQRLIPCNEEMAMLHLEKVLTSLNVEHFSLEKSYRSTREIMEYANKYLDEQRIVPLVRSGRQVEEEDYINEEQLIERLHCKLKEDKEKGYESTAILCRDSKEAQRIGSLIRQKDHINIIDNEDIIYNGGMVVIPSYFAKGLEFDSVVLIHGKNKQQDGKLMYVMSTRALHELSIYGY